MKIRIERLVASDTRHPAGSVPARPLDNEAGAEDAEGNEEGEEEEVGSDSVTGGLDSWGSRGGGWGEDEWLEEEEEEEEEWVLDEDSREERGGGWCQFWNRRGGGLGAEEALCVVGLVDACCNHVSLCLADHSPHPSAPGAQAAEQPLGGLMEGAPVFGGQRWRYVHDGMGAVSCMSDMCGCGGGGSERGAGVCRVGDHVRRLEALALCLERLCLYPAL